MANKKTSWGKVAQWYKNLLEGEGTYQKEVILPNLLRNLGIKKGETVLDLACGPGFFADEFLKAGAKVVGADISQDLIDIAKQETSPKIRYFTSAADDLSFLPDGSVDKAVIVLAIQNIENVQGVFKECGRVLRPGGKLFLVMNHPVFRIPKASSWGWDAERGIQYRRVDRYLSESKVKIQMHPSISSGRMLSPKDYTISFHRPLQFYFKLLDKNNFCVRRLEEWISNRISDPGPRSQAENRSRKEIPLFLFLEAASHSK